MPNIALDLLNESKIRPLLEAEVLPLYPEYDRVAEIKIVPHKKNIWITTYHVVVEYCCVFESSSGQSLALSIFCSAHSCEPRDKAYQAAQFLWNSSLRSLGLALPRPLFYSSKYRAFFYRGVAGHTLYYYMKRNKLAEATEIVDSFAYWLASLHHLPLGGYTVLANDNARVATATPGRDEILAKSRLSSPELALRMERLFQIIEEREEAYFQTADSLCFVHGDAHPENVVRVKAGQSAMIDFADFHIGDRARDLGSFRQQLTYMAHRKMPDYKSAPGLQEKFFSSYNKYYQGESEPGLDRRIDTYHAWTAMRTATYFLISHHLHPERAEPLIDEAEKYLGI